MSVIIALIGLQYSSSTIAELYVDHSSSVFKFAQRMANTGRIESKYTLGTLYEAGIGTEVNLEQAMHWYRQAAAMDFEPASDRIAYLTIKSTGYKQLRDDNWFTNLIKKAEDKDEDATLILAKMYKHGLGVKKDLHTSRYLLSSLSLQGNSEIDAELAALEI